MEAQNRFGATSPAVIEACSRPTPTIATDVIRRQPPSQQTRETRSAVRAAAQAARFISRAAPGSTTEPGSEAPDGA